MIHRNIPGWPPAIHEAIRAEAEQEEAHLDGAVRLGVQVTYRW